MKKHLRNILSLFDGISAGQLALIRANISYDKYYASEINKYAIAVTKYHFPNTIFVGDVRNLNGYQFHNIDLIMGGSPCQNFSTSAKIKGALTQSNIEITSLNQYLELKSQNTTFKGQSYLFWEFARLLHEIKPKYFLLENVKMPRKWMNIISNTLHVDPIEINSSLVSAQHRKRLYWTNIPVSKLPDDKNILLIDILETNVDDKYFLKTNVEIGALNPLHRRAQIITDKEKSYTIDANYYKRTTPSHYLTKKRRQLVFHIPPNNHHSLKPRILTPTECERLQTLPDDYTKYGLFHNNTIKLISNTQRYKMIGNSFTVDVIAHILSFID